MTDQTLQAYHENNAEHQMHPYQSMWMAHWTRESHTSESDRVIEQERMLVQVADPILVKRIGKALGPGNISECRHLQRCPEDLKVLSYVSDSSKAVKVEISDKGVEIRNEAPITNSRKHARSDPSLLCCINQNVCTSLARKEDLFICNTQASISQIDNNTTISTSAPSFPSRLPRLGTSELGFPSKDTHPENISEAPLQWSKPSRPWNKKSLLGSRDFLNKHTVSTSDRVSFEIISGRTPVKSFMDLNDETDQNRLIIASKEHFANTNFTRLEQGDCSCRSFSTFLVCDKKINNHPPATSSGKICKSSYARKNDEAHRPNVPSTSNICLQASVREYDKGRSDFSGTGLLPCNNRPPGTTRYNGLCCVTPSCSVHDVETLRICRTSNSGEELTGGPLRFSQTTHHVMIANKSGFHLSKEDQILNDLKVSSHPQAKAFNDLSVPPHFCCHDRRTAKFQALRNSTGGVNEEETGDSKNCVCSKNESTAETDIVDIGNREAKKSLVGIASSPVYKDFIVNQRPAKSLAAMLWAKEAGTRKTEVNSMIQEIPEPFAAGNSNKKASNISVTERMDVEHIYPVAQPAKLNSSTQPNVPLIEPNNRWVKRLKLNGSDSLAVGPKSSNTEDAPSSKRANDLFRKIMKYSRSSSESIPSKCHSKREMLNRNIVLLQNWGPSSLDWVKKYRELPLSHPWIRRWCSPSQVPNERPKPARDEYRRKQVPSISAMALMGKANCFRPCKFRKKGSVIVWHTENIGLC